MTLLRFGIGLLPINQIIGEFLEFNFIKTF